jgi:cytochrome c-type biogenesis protein CcmH
MAKCLLLLLLLCAGAMAKEAAPVAADPALEARVVAITAELRCLVCQNQTIADSTSGLADDLRNQVREQLRKGASDAQVLAFMTERYGDFVLYRPPFKASTALLWVGPTALLVIGLSALVLVLRRRSKLAADRFEPDADDDDATTDGDPAR